jgi:Rap1a immunity proteins
MKMENLKMKVLIVCFTLVSSMCFAQIASISKLQTAGSFLEVCGRADTQLSREQGETVKNAPPSQVVDSLKKAMDDRLAEETMCIGYVAGLVEGWKEGHEHGVAAAQFPDGWPQDEEKALIALPLKQLQAANAAMKVDVPCIPDYVTIGQQRDIVVKYIREQQTKNPFIGIAMTHRVIWLAFQQAFPCTLQPK